jgi:pimeloyl-ACP methyl ester carboxylesterase
VVPRIVSAVALLAAAAYLAASCGGCLAPPLVLPGGLPIRDVGKLPYPPASEAVEVEVEPGRFLHGVFVPADEGAPVVVHLLESSGSFTPSIYARTEGPLTVTAVVGARHVAWELADLGLASLIVDYGGVGPSDGERDAGTLGRDAEAIWDEALRRTGGREDRIVVRGTSLGALAAAHLLQAGRQPAALLLIAPVRAETVVRHFARATRGALVAFLVAPWFGRGIDVDLERIVGATAVPTLVVVARDDELLPADEQQRLRRAVERAGGGWVVLEPDDERLASGRTTINGVPTFPAGDHFPIAYAARRLLAEERDFLARVLPSPPSDRRRAERLLASLEPGLRDRFAEGCPERATLEAVAAGRLHDDATLLALAVLAGCTPDECRCVLDHARRTGELQPVPLEAWMGGRDRDACLSRLDLSDPAGRVPVDVVTALATHVAWAGRQDDWEDASWDFEHTLAFARGAARERKGSRAAVRRYASRSHGGTTHRLPLEEPWNRLASLGMDETDACRLLLRAILKAAGIAERVVDGGGVPRLEVHDGDAWREVDPRILLEPAEG